MNKIKETQIEREETAKLFDSRCYLCNKKFGKKFHFHHIGYRKDEKKHSDFDSHYDYTMYVLPIIEKHPEKFSLLCMTCHHLITILQSIKEQERFERVVDLSRRSRNDICKECKGINNIHDSNCSEVAYHPCQ